jgi:hypothetical protein
MSTKQAHSFFCVLAEWNAEPKTRYLDDKAIRDVKTRIYSTLAYQDYLFIFAENTILRLL